VRDLGKGWANVGNRERGKVRIGVDIPSPAEIRAIRDAAEPRWRVLLTVAALTGLRVSELRGLRWADVDLKKSELHVRQRADRFKKIGPPKSRAGERTVPIPAPALSMLREWKLACPIGSLDLVFPNDKGGILAHEAVIHRALIPAQLAAGVTVPVKDADGKLIEMKAKYTGIHALRHFYELSPNLGDGRDQAAAA